MEKHRNNTVAITIALVLCLLDLYKHLPPRTRSSFILAVIQFTKVQFFDPLSTNLLYWAHWTKIPYILGLGCKSCLYRQLLNFRIFLGAFPLTKILLIYYSIENVTYLIKYNISIDNDSQSILKSLDTHYCKNQQKHPNLNPKMQAMYQYVPRIRLSI